MMRMVDLIEKKKQKEVLTKKEIDYIIEEYSKDRIPDYQMSAMLMAITLNGMSDEETTDLAIAMLNSGEIIDLSEINGIKVDKHSTGGVGDKTTLIIGPMLAALDIKFAKMSGKGLGHTGGTIDKLMSIPGFNVDIADKDFIKQVNDINIAVIGQSKQVAIADKKLYSLRDVTATVSSIPLIASSIMSKKLASGADAICLDVKVGSGAFMKNIDEAKHLAELMVKIGQSCGKKMTAILTDMSKPLGNAIGNSLEVIEAIDTLNGKGPKDLLEVCLTIASYLVLDSNKADSLKDARELLENTIKSKKALNKFIEFIAYQGGDISYINNPSLFKKSEFVISVISKETGYISKVDALKLGVASMMLGAGRNKLEDVIDYSVGLVLKYNLGDYVKKGDILATIYSNKNDIEEVINMVYNSYNFSEIPIKHNLILDVIK